MQLNGKEKRNKEGKRGAEVLKNSEKESKKHNLFTAEAR